MSNAQLETAIEAAWEGRDAITSATTGETRDAIEDTLAALDGGTLRVAEKQDDGSWHVNQWAKKAVDAVFCEPRRLCRRGHDGRHMGHRGQLRADRQERAPVGWRWHWRRVGADAGRANYH